MKKILIIVIGLAVLGGGGFFAWTTFMGGRDAGSVDGSLAASQKSPVYVEMEPLTAPFIRDGRFAQYVVLVVNLEVANEKNAERIQARMPELRDAFVTELHTLAALRPPDQKLINLARIKARLLAGANRVMGNGVVRDVLVQLAH